MKEKEKVESSNPQLSFEFSRPFVSEQPVETENGKVIRLSEHVSSDKSKIDYYKLVLKHTKSF